MAKVRAWRWGKRGAGLLGAVGLALGVGSLGAGSGTPADILSRQLTAVAVRELLTAEETAGGFRVTEAARALALVAGSEPVTVTVALRADQPRRDSAVWAAGVVVMRIDASAAYAPLGLAAGRNYLWIDGKGPAGEPWRAAMLSADGVHRVLVGQIRYTAGAEHGDLTSPQGHALRYCGGEPGCLVLRLGPDGQKYETVWMRCVDGCCELEN